MCLHFLMQIPTLLWLPRTVEKQHWSEMSIALGVPFRFTCCDMTSSWYYIQCSDVSILQNDQHDVIKKPLVVTNNLVEANPLPGPQILQSPIGPSLLGLQQGDDPLLLIPLGLASQTPRVAMIFCHNKVHAPGCCSHSTCSTSWRLISVSDFNRVDLGWFESLSLVRVLPRGTTVIIIAVVIIIIIVFIIVV